VVRTHSVSRTKYGYRTTSVMDFDGWTRVPRECLRVVPDDVHTRGHSVRTKTRHCTGQKDTRIVYTRPMSSIPKKITKTSACTPNDIVRVDDGRRAIDDVRTSLSSGQNVRRSRHFRCVSNVKKLAIFRRSLDSATGSHRVCALKTRATYGSRARAVGRARSLCMYVSIYLSIDGS